MCAYWLALALALHATAAAARPAADAPRQAQVAALMDQARTRTPQLRALLQAMPKGADLHNHLGGSIYAEDFLRWAAEDGLCVARSDDHAISAGPCDAERVPARGLAARDAALYAATVDALSMRNYQPGQGAASGHDQFFRTFARFDALNPRKAEQVAATLEQAARDRVSYVELMTNPTQSGVLAKLAAEQPWQGQDLQANLAPLEAQLPGLVAQARDEFAQLDAKVRTLLRCETAAASAACQVRYRYMPYVLRVLPPAAVFGQMLMGYALADADPRRVAGVNIVAPEDHPVALADYRLHMAMFRTLSQRYRQVPLALHAGELTLGLVPPEALRFHIREAVAAGARRIGHGVDIGYEDAPYALLQAMARDGVAVEINLSSNDGILGVKGADHPLHMYLQAGVPVVLSTDDEGVSRSDMTQEYLRAVQEQQLDYPTLKQIVRNGLTYAFIPGQSLWKGDGRTPVGSCAAALSRPLTDPDAACANLIQNSEKAQLQWQLERDLASFELETLALHAQDARARRGGSGSRSR
ncbi:adenosine deaminase family protein [Pseudoxanthomonas composti]|uniref:adenosine deaminase n=1 Tax=Pseudoxanthomonas composti TaxID=2137479 RepID=A0A4Q1K0C2_9GAMM|nr:adenosine deaminase [Pseudoxanthomonas composti]RXR08887.1 adenosine deaminase [Pseudoxanthomonas composti]